MKTDANAQTRTNGPSSYVTKRTQEVPTASVTASQGNGAAAEAAGTPQKGSQRFDVDWFEKLANVVPNVENVLPEASEAEEVQEAGNSQDVAAQSEGKYGTQAEGITSNAVLTDQNYVPTTKQVVAGSGAPTANLHQELPSKNSYETAASENQYLYSSAAAQRRGEPVKPSNTSANATAKAPAQPGQEDGGPADLRATASDSLKQSLPTTGQQLNMSPQEQTMQASSGQQAYERQQETTLANESPGRNTLLPSAAENSSIPFTAQPAILTTTLATSLPNLAPTVAARIETTARPASSTAMPTSKVIAETKATDRQNASEFDAAINPVTGSVILTEKVSYADLKNDTDNDEQNVEKKVSGLLPQGPSIFYSEYMKNPGSYPDQRSSIGVEGNEEKALYPQTKSADISNMFATTQPNENQNTEGQRSEIQGSESQGSEGQGSVGQRSDGQGLAGRSASVQSSLNEQKAYTSSYASQPAFYTPTEASDNGNEKGNEVANGGYGEEATYGLANPSARVQIPSAETDGYTGTQNQNNIDADSVNVMDNSQADAQEQDSGEAKVRVIRTLPATLMPPLTSPLLENQANEEREMTGNAQPSTKAGTETTSQSIPSTRPTNPVTGDMMVLNNKLGIEQVESGDYLGTPAEVASQHVFTPRFPEQTNKTGAANGTLQKIFSNIVGDEFLGKDAVVSSESDDGKQTGNNDQDVGESKEEKTDEKQEVESKNEENSTQEDKTETETQESKNVDVTSEKENEKPESSDQKPESSVQNAESSDQTPEFSEDPALQKDDKASELINQTMKLVDQNGNNADQTYQTPNHDSASADQSLKALDQSYLQGGQSFQSPNQESTTPDDEADQLTDQKSLPTVTSDQTDKSTNQEQQSTKQSDQRDQSTNQESVNQSATPTGQPTESSNQASDPPAITPSKNSSISQNNGLAPQADASENAARRGTIEAENVREPNIPDGGDEFEVPRANFDGVDHGLEDLLLHPDRLPPQTVAEDVPDEEKDVFEVNDMVVHDDLDRRR